MKRRHLPRLPVFFCYAGLAIVLATTFIPPLMGQTRYASVNGPIEPEAPLGPCGDELSDALNRSPNEVPCWADIRAPQHWNTLDLSEGGTINGSRTFSFIPEEPSEFRYALGGLGGSTLAQQPEAQVYSGVAAVSGVLKRRQWRLMAEDVGGLGDYETDKVDTANLAGLNRAAVRALGELGQRWSWQASATNAFGNDVFRTFAPLDYATIGESEAPVPATVAYGLHSGNVVSEQENLRFAYADSERSHWVLSAAHTFQHYADDGFTAQTIGGRAEYLHSETPNSAFGVYANASNQNGFLACTVGGGGIQGLHRWGKRASINVEAGAAGASKCGKSVQFLGSAALYLPVTGKVDVYALASRDFSAGIIEHAAFLSSAGAGVRYAITPNTSLRLSGAAIYGTDPLTNVSYDGSFSEIAVSSPLGAHLMQDLALRHYQVAGADNRTVITYTLWWSHGPPPPSR